MKRRIVMAVNINISLRSAVK